MWYMSANHQCATALPVTNVLQLCPSQMCYISASHQCATALQLTNELQLCQSPMCYSPASHQCATALPDTNVLQLCHLPLSFSSATHQFATSLALTNVLQLCYSPLRLSSGTHQCRLWCSWWAGPGQASPSLPFSSSSLTQSQNLHAPHCKNQYRKFETNILRKELRGHSPNFHLHVSVSDLYIPTIDLPILLQWTDPGNI
jgi:hypothetical protein